MIGSAACGVLGAWHPWARTVFMLSSGAALDFWSSVCSSRLGVGTVMRLTAAKQGISRPFDAVLA